MNSVAPGPVAFHPPAAQRQAYMVLSPHSLSYATLALRSLLARSAEPLNLHLITDSAADRQTLSSVVEELEPSARHAWSVTAEDELADAEAATFARYPSLRAFRHGHPCWRKITDPVLLSATGEELLVLDPDLYFPNQFCFEPTPASGLLLMWQRPNCLLPSPVVRTALAANIALARHVDIGVAHWRLSTDLAELEWIDWLIGKLGGRSLPRVMHVEAIVWAAIALRFGRDNGGNGYLDPQLWRCWHRTQGNRLRRKLGASGRSILAAEPWPQIKCFHAGGEAKWWLPDMVAAGEIPEGADLRAAGRILPFVELTSARYEHEQTAKTILGGLGYYRLFGPQRS